MEKLVLSTCGQTVTIYIEYRPTLMGGQLSYRYSVGNDVFLRAPVNVPPILAVSFSQ